MLVCPECGATEPGRTSCSRDGASLLESGPDELLGQVVGGFRVARLLGRGGMGAVYLGVHPEFGSRVAIKVIRPSDACDLSHVQRFFAEARSVNLIQHENIINVLNLAHLPDGRPYIMMEYVEGASLSAHLRQGVGARRLLGVGVEILDALAAAHAKGIVHRDLKPDNVMLTPEGRVKLLDFGIAKLRIEGEASQHLTATGSVLGTPAYMSPEQARALPTDARSDLYSFGIMLYEGLTGAVPFQGDSLFEVLRQHVSEAPPPLSAARPDLPPALQALVERTLAKDPAQRPSSAAELRALLLALLPHVLDTQPTSGVPTSGSWTGASYPSLGGSSQWSLPGTHLSGSLELTGAPAARRSPLPSRGTSALKWLVVAVLGLLVAFVALGAVALAAVVLHQLSASPSSARPTASTTPVAAPAAGQAVEAAGESPTAAPGREPLAATSPRSTSVAVTPRTAPEPTRDTAPVPTPAPSPTASPAAPPTASPKTTTAATAAPTARKPTPAEAFAESNKRPSAVVVHSEPDGASITFDGRAVGKAYLKLENVPQGAHVVVASLPGYKTQTQNITVDVATRLVICRLQKLE